MDGMNSSLFEIKENDLSGWIEWVKHELPTGGICITGEDAEFLVTTRAVQFAERIKEIVGHVPATLNNLLIQAAIIHQCWNRNRQTPKFSSQEINGSLANLEGVLYVNKISDNLFLMQTSDGRYWDVVFPRSDQETSLASEVIATTMAKMIGLPTFELATIAVSKPIAMQMGIISKGWPRYMERNGRYRCLGRLHEDLEQTKPLKVNPKIVRLLNGLLIFDIFVHIIKERKLQSGFSLAKHKPVFTYQHALHDGDWKAFLQNKFQYSLETSHLVLQVTSYQQLEVWIKKIRNIEFNNLWKIIFGLPPEWYGEQRALLASVVLHMEDHAIDLNQSIRSLIKKGYFPNIKEDPDEECSSRGKSLHRMA